MKKTILAAFALLTLSTGAFAQSGGPGRQDPRLQPGYNNGSGNDGYGNRNGYGNDRGYTNGYGTNSGSYNSGSCNNGYGTNGGYNNGPGYGYGTNADPRYGNNNGYSYVRSHPIYSNVMAARLPLYEQRGVLRELARIEQMEWAFGRNGRVGPREQAVLARELAQLDARLQRNYRRSYVRY